jgi:hypothetical protein
MCLESDQGVGAFVRCGWPHCHNVFVVCACCDRGQVYCSIACRIASRAWQVKQARRKYARSRTGKMLRSLANRRYRANKSAQIEMDHGFRQGQNSEKFAPDVTEPLVGPDVRASEGPCHDNLVQQPCPKQPNPQPPAGGQGPVGPQVPQEAVRAATPILRRCQLCGAPVRWIVDRDRLASYRQARRALLPAHSKRLPKMPTYRPGPT